MSLQNLTFSFNFQPKERLTVFALQIGGFYPLFFCNAKLLLVDRNIVSHANNINYGGGHRDNKANAWWFSFINDPRYIINASLAAIEGPNQSVPTFDQFRKEFQRCRDILNTAFPKAHVLDYNETAYQGAYALLGEITRQYEEEVVFLRQAAPMVAIPHPRAELPYIEEKLFKLARAANLERATFSLIACLSCLYDDPSTNLRSPGRAVIKPKNKYSRAMAHNALMDLYALLLLIQGTAKLDPNIALCTSDKGLVRFWCALKVKGGGVSTSEGFNVDLEYSHEMFPRLEENEILHLKHRTEEYDF